MLPCFLKNVIFISLNKSAAGTALCPATALTLIRCHYCSTKEPGPRGAIGRAPDLYVRGPGFDTRSGNILSFLLPLFSKRAVVSYWRKYVHEVLVNRLEGLNLPRKSVVRLTDRPDMTLDVYRGRKTTTQQQQNPRRSLGSKDFLGAKFGDRLFFFFFFLRIHMERVF